MIAALAILGAVFLVAVTPFVIAVVIEAIEHRPRALPRMTCDEARELARQLHESAAWHCGCSACRAWRRHCGGAS